jgi:predicted HicB family RNase H-like nuclease
MGYHGKVEFDDEAGIFHGDVINTRDVITFQGKSVAELKKAFRDSIEDYLTFCAERGALRAPAKPVAAGGRSIHSHTIRYGTHVRVASLDVSQQNR